MGCDIGKDFSQFNTFTQENIQNFINCIDTYKNYNKTHKKLQVEYKISKSISWDTTDDTR